MKPLGRLFSRKPAPKTEEEIAELIERFADGTGSRWDWDYFISTDFESERVTRAKMQCLRVEEEFPRAGRVGWCSEQGVDRLRAVAFELRASARKP